MTRIDHGSEVLKIFQAHTTNVKLDGAGFTHDAAVVASLQEPMKMMNSKVELIYCVMAVATAVLAGVMKCTASAACSRCSGMVDPFD
ncbi:hypothetical protein [Stenotrophomonas sp.]|uniref:hypothetical protein n=1 Tax=Stenotrophomonas sp. TaxID=69392 RepID=UPI0028AC1E04|nr:hypothetical protein [Stenotrophomonas sp.]